MWTPRQTRWKSESRGASGVISARGLCKRFHVGESVIEVLRGADLDVAQGEIVAIVGPSGVGKSTLLHLLGGLDRPDSGSVTIASTALLDLNDRELANFRNRHIGFVFQFHHLLAEFTAVENVMMPLLIRDLPRGGAHDKAQALLEELGLDDRSSHLPSELSGGERQRVAFARALVAEPTVILADEPSGNLDGERSEALHNAMITYARGRGQTFVVVTHDSTLASRADRVVRLEGGLLGPE